MDSNVDLELAKATAARAGQLLREIAAQPLDVLSSIGKDIKLQADKDSEALIVSALNAASPHTILTEEAGELGDNFNGRFWVIDPLDGTLNYSRGVPVCCVSIALVDGSGGTIKPLVGVVYDFNRDELFSASAGDGAHLNGKPMRASRIDDPAKAIVSMGFPSYTDYTDEALLPAVRRVQSFKKVRMIGAAAVSLAWVACGRIDAYAEDDVMLWDVAGGMLLVREAGGSAELINSTKGKWAWGIKTAGNPDIWRDVS